MVYVFSVLLIALIGVGVLVMANRHFAPEMYSADGPIEIAEALAEGRNFAVFDLNVNIREIRDAHIARMQRAPELAILGASHWQEAHADLLQGVDAFNAHVHRDYYEDMLAVTEMFVRHDKLPRQMILSIRDNLFTAVQDRRDHLWLPGAPYARAMAKRLGIEPLGMIETLAVRRWQEVISPQMLFNNVNRWFNADETPHATQTRYFKSLDTLLPGGSIIWSRDHRALFTAERAKALSVTFAAQNAKLPPKVDARGYAAIDALIGYLRSKGVQVVLAQPPFNPEYFDLVRDTLYMDGLREVDAATKRLADKHGLRKIGSFDPAHVGCDASMFIDAEHSNAACLSRVLDEYIHPAGKRPQMGQEVASTSFGMKYDFGPKHGTAPGLARIGALVGRQRDRAGEPVSDSLLADKTVEMQRLAIQANAAKHVAVPLVEVSTVQSAVIARAADVASAPTFAAIDRDDIALQQQLILRNVPGRAADPSLASLRESGAALEAEPNTAWLHLPQQIVVGEPAGRAREIARPRRQQRSEELQHAQRKPAHHLRQRVIKRAPRQLVWPGDSQASATGRTLHASVR